MSNMSNAHWRDSARSVRFFMLDGRAAFPLVLVLIWPRFWTLVVALVSVLFFTIISRFGYTPMVFLRLLRSFFAGRHVQSQPWWMK